MDNKLFFDNAYFIIGTSYAGKSTMVKELAKNHAGIACEENYHDNYPGELDKGEFPCLTYTRDLVDWHDFIRRSPQEYKDWIDGVKKECEILELRMLPEICACGKKVFVDTNISVETLRNLIDVSPSVYYDYEKGFIIKSKRSLSGAPGRVVSRVLSTTVICLGVCVAAQLFATSEIPLRGGRAALLSHGVASDRVYICMMLPSVPVSSYLAFPPLLREPQTAKRFEDTSARSE